MLPLVTASPPSPTMQATAPGGITTMPSFGNCHAVTATPSRRSAISQRIVASEPVTERLGPRSTPINSPLVTCTGTSALWLTVAATRLVGRLLRRFDAKATTAPRREVSLGGTRNIPQHRKRRSPADDENDDRHRYAGNERR